MVPVLVLGLPIFDTTLVVLSRLRRGAPIYLGAKDHLSHRLLARGFTAREAVMVHYLVTGACGVAAMFVMLSNALEAYATAALIAAGASVALWKFEFSAGAKNGK
jgi:UDP-GlcNAc:undecaprenyl-phosphate GlcNAc-1-phosphate transferase